MENVNNSRDSATDILKEVTIYTDGSCLGNPGNGGYCAILFYKEHKKVLTAGYRLTTNNRMELLAVITALSALKMPCRVTLYSDSKYVIDGITKWISSWTKRNWKNVQNVDLWKKLAAIASKHTITWNWVKGHDNDIYNNECDELARQAAQGENLLEDEGYRNVV